MKISFISLGCPKNTVNSEQMLYLVQQAGHFFLTQHGAGLFEQRGRVFGEPDVKRFATADDVHQRADGLLQRCVRIRAVVVEHVHIIQLQAAQALVQP